MDEPLVCLLCERMHRRVAMFGRDKPLKASKREAPSKINIPPWAPVDDGVDRWSVYA